LVGEKVAGDADVLGGDLQARALLDGAGVIEIRAHRDADAALRNVEVQRLVQACASVFDQRVLARDANVGATVLNVSGNVSGAHNHHAQVRLVGGQDQLARGFRVFEHLDTCRLEQRQGLVEDASLG
jgi:hypothetical protein